MALDIQDLQPKPFDVTIKGQTTQCQPLRMAHIFILNKIGTIFREPDKASREQLIEAESDFDYIIGELIPELHGSKVEVSVIMEIITQLMENITPSENKELEDKGVSFDPDPKVPAQEISNERIG